MRSFLLLLSLLTLSVENYCMGQNIVIEEQSISTCYLSDCSHSVIRAEAELECLFVVAYLDCSFPINEECDASSFGQYIPNSISVNGKMLELGTDLLDNNINVFNLGRFFIANDSKMKYLIFEMANVDDLNAKYSYITICLNSKNEIISHFSTNDNNSPLTDEELSSIIEDIRIRS